MNPDRPQAPHLDDDLTPLVASELFDETDWTTARVSGDVTDQRAAGVDIASCHITGMRLTGARIERLRVVDTVFEMCELSGAILHEAVLTRVEFRNCRLSGATLAGARLTRCRLDDVTGVLALRGVVIDTDSQIPVALALLAAFDITVDDDES
jgi:hypothetical protein